MDNAVEDDSKLLPEPNLRLLQRKHPHPKDRLIKFYSDGHRYEIDFKNNGSYESSNVMSVTTMVRCFFPEFDSDEVIKTMMSNKNFEKYHKDLVGLTAEQIKEKWSKNGEESRNMGTQLHAQIECILNEETPLVCDTIELKQFGEFAEMAAGNKMQPYRTEFFVFTDDETRVAGSIDCIYVDSEKTQGFNPSNSLFIKMVDWKRVKAIKKWNVQRQCGFGPCKEIMCANYFEYSIQQHMYKYILEHFYERPTWNGKEYSKFVVTQCYLCPLHPSKKKLSLEECVDYSAEVAEMFALRKDSLKRKLSGQPELYPFDKSCAPPVETAPEPEQFDYNLL